MISQPMKQQWFLILLSLSKGPLHGYGIQRSVLDRTDGRMRLWPAMLYRSLSTLEEEGLICQTATPEGVPDDQRRQYYALTGAGQVRLRSEVEMLSRWIAAADLRAP